jgi:DNA-binding NtrC family response regulator
LQAASGIFLKKKLSLFVKQSIQERDSFMSGSNVYKIRHDVTVSTDSKKALSTFQKNPDILIILCTGYSQLITPEKSNIFGIKEFLMKPFSRNEIAEAIRKVLDKNQS